MSSCAFADIFEQVYALDSDIDVKESEEYKIGLTYFNAARCGEVLQRRVGVDRAAPGLPADLEAGPNSVGEWTDLLLPTLK